MSYRVFMRFPEGKAKALTFSYDDGVKYDAKLTEIFDRCGMRVLSISTADVSRQRTASTKKMNT